MFFSIERKDASLPSPGASIAGVLCCESVHTILLYRHQIQEGYLGQATRVNTGTQFGTTCTINLPFSR